MAGLEGLGYAALLSWLTLALLAWAVRTRPEHAPHVVHRRSLLALFFASASFSLPWLKEALLTDSAFLAPLQVSVRLLASSAAPGPVDPVRRLAISPFAILASVWALSSAVASLRCFAAWLRLRRLLARAEQAPAAEHATLDEELAKVGARPPRLLVSEEAASPFSLGIFRPVIVLPRAVVDALDDAALRLVLRHELLHLKRRDPLTHLLARLSALLFAGHPSLPSLLRQLSLSRELAVDGEAAREEPHAYAQVLLRLAELTRFGADSAQVAMDDTALSRRIAWLIAAPRLAAPSPLAPLAAAALAVAASLVAPRVVPELSPPSAVSLALSRLGAGEPFVARAELPFGLALPARDPLAAYQHEISSCYELARREDRGLSVDTLARFSLDPATFAVVDVDLAAPGSRVFERCITQRAKAWRFPPPPGAPPLPAELAADVQAVVAVHIERHP